jgi:hypothetical protein
MGVMTKAKDWQVSGSGQITAAAIGGAGAWLFDFKSNTARCTATFVFLGLGFGGGSKVGGWTTLKEIVKKAASALSVSPTSFDPIECDRPFSAYDLDSSGGRIADMGVSNVVGYGATFISAGALSSLFRTQLTHGIELGVGRAGITTVGLWMLVGASELPETAAALARAGRPRSRATVRVRRRRSPFAGNGSSEMNGDKGASEVVLDLPVLVASRSLRDPT